MTRTKPIPQRSVFGRWTVLAFAGVHPRGKRVIPYYLCRCECGNEGIVPAVNLRRGDSKSCGCLASDVQSARLRRFYRTDGPLPEEFE